MYKKMVLVVDDDPNIRDILCGSLIDCGYNVLQAGNGIEAMQVLAESGLPHLVITDIVMPKKHGLNTILEIREKYPYLKILAISGGGFGRVSGENLNLAEQAGADTVLAKPFNMGEFEKLVARLVA